MPRKRAPFLILLDCAARGVCCRIDNIVRGPVVNITCRTPPPDSDVKPQPFKKIPKLVGRPDVSVERVRQSVRRFMNKRSQRGRPEGSKKTTSEEDKEILSTFYRIRKPLGKLVESPDVWRAMPRRMRNKVLPASCKCRLRYVSAHC